MTNAEDDDGSTPSLARSSAVMAVGTLASRLTGFLRTVVIAAAMGLTVAESYNVANTIPNILYDLLLGGVLTSVVVPLLVQAAHDDGDNGEAYAQRLVTIVGTTLARRHGDRCRPRAADRRALRAPARPARATSSP